MKINPDSPFMESLSMMADYMLLNVLFLICCIPVVTIGPAVSALYTVSMRTVRSEGGYIAKPFLKAMKANFRQSFLLGLLYGAAGGMLVYSFAYWRGRGFGTLSGKMALFFLAAAIAVYLLSLLYVFPLHARFENRLPQTVKNALIVAMFNPKETLLLCLIVAAAAVLFLFTNIFWLFMLLMGFAVLAHIQSGVFVKVFRKYETQSGES